MLDAFRTEVARYRGLAEKALAQTDDVGFFGALDPNANSIAVLVKHLGGNLRSRFTDFLTSDGEKPWRDRDAEFDAGAANRDELMAGWAAGWAVLEHVLAELREEQLETVVTIRGQPLTVAEALTRSVAHAAGHVGQIVLLAKHAAGDCWETLSIAKGGSAAYNENPTRERTIG